MSVQETFRLAHTAQCKLHIAADRPDRNLRFILGHAFTLDKLRLRIAEIEEDISDDDFIEEPPKERRVSFHSHSHNPTPSIPYDRKRSPPPTKTSPSPSPPPELGEYDDEDEEGLSLRRFASAADQPPRMVDDESSSDEEDEPEPRSPPPLSNEELEELTKGPGDDKLASAYRGIYNCVCNADGAPTADKVWEVPSKEGEKRLAVISVAA